MNEKAWLTATRPWLLMDVLGTGTRGFGGQEKRLSARQSRLLAAACVRRVWSVLTDPRSRRAVEVAEEFADGLCSEDDLREAHAAASQVQRGATEFHNYAAQAAAEAVRFPEPVRADGWARAATRLRSERVFQCGLIRDLVGNPFRPVLSESVPLTSTVRGLAQAAYAERLMPAGILDPDRMAILADALEDAGCVDAAVLEHLRGPDMHIRGCWLLDRILVSGSEE
jgi:hypothetical protein